jgi:hypothetical protein
LERLFLPDSVEKLARPAAGGNIRTQAALLGGRLLRYEAAARINISRAHRLGTFSTVSPHTCRSRYPSGPAQLGESGRSPDGARS